MSAALSASQRFQNLIANGQLQCIFVVGTPRGCGTAEHQALTQPDEMHGQLNEPFFYPEKALKGRKFDYLPPLQNPIRTFDTGCEHILKRYHLAVEKLKLTEEQRKNTKIGLVIHELSHHFNLEEFRKIVPMSSHMVFAIRNTTQQIFSTLARYVNDKISQPGGNKIAPQETLTLMQSTAAFKEFWMKNPTRVSPALLNSLLGKSEQNEKLCDEDFEKARKSVLDLTAEQSSIAWENLHCFYEVTKKEFAAHPHTVFDAESLFKDTEANLKQLCKRIKVITYTDKMVNGWTKGTGDDFHCVITEGWGAAAQTNAWNGPARNSKGITVQPGSIEKSIQVAQFPKELQSVIQKLDALYQQMYSDRMKLEQVQKMAADPANGVALASAVGAAPAAIIGAVSAAVQNK